MREGRRRELGFDRKRQTALKEQIGGIKKVWGVGQRLLGLNITIKQSFIAVHSKSSLNPSWVGDM